MFVLPSASVIGKGAPRAELGRGRAAIIRFMLWGPWCSVSLQDSHNATPAGFIHSPTTSPLKPEGEEKEAFREHVPIFPICICDVSFTSNWPPHCSQTVFLKKKKPDAVTPLPKPSTASIRFCPYDETKLNVTHKALPHLAPRDLFSLVHLLLPVQPSPPDPSTPLSSPPTRTGPRAQTGLGQVVEPVGEMRLPGGYYSWADHEREGNPGERNRQMTQCRNYSVALGRSFLKCKLLGEVWRQGKLEKQAQGSSSMTW